MCFAHAQLDCRWRPIEGIKMSVCFDDEFILLNKLNKLSFDGLTESGVDDDEEDDSSIDVLMTEPSQRTHEDCVKIHKLLSKLKCFNSFNSSIQSQLCQQAILIQINDKNVVLLQDNEILDAVSYQY